MIKTIDNHFSKQVWNDCADHPLQAWEWGEARKELNVGMLRVGEFEGSRLKNVFQITFHKIPFTKYRVGYLPRSVWPSKKILNFLYDYAKRNNTVFIKIEPYEESEKLKAKSEKQQLKTKNYSIVKSPHPLFPDWTQLIDLTNSEEDLLKNMKPKTRYNIKLAQKKGVIIKEMTNDEGFEIFAKLYFETTKRQKYYGHDYSYHKAIFENLKDKIAHILIAYYDNIPLAAHELFHFKDAVYYVYGGSSEKHRNLMTAHLLMWESIRFGKKIGSKKFDMWGSLPINYDENHPWAGFTRFKEGFGGKFMEFLGSFDLVTNQIIYKLYNTVYGIRTKYLDLKGVLRN